MTNIPESELEEELINQNEDEPELLDEVMHPFNLNSVVESVFKLREKVLSQGLISSM